MGLDGLRQVSVVGDGSALNGQYGYLLQDQFSVHMKEENIATTQRAGVEVDFIPAGYTACLQVLDKGVNKPFKQFIRDHSISWLQQAPQGAKPSGLNVTNWISYSWNQIKAETITNTWISQIYMIVSKNLHVH